MYRISLKLEKQGMEKMSLDIFKNEKKNVNSTLKKDKKRKEKNTQIDISKR